MPKRECNESTVFDRMTAMAGTRYQSAQLARYYGVNWMVIRRLLEALHAQGKIRRVRVAGNPTVWYIPSGEQLLAEGALMRVEPVSAPAPKVKRPMMSWAELCKTTGVSE